MIEEPHLRLAGVTRLSVRGVRSERVPFELDAFVFDPHRLAFPSWAVGLEDRPAATLLTLDRHFDLVAPTAPAPQRSAGLHALDDYARWSLDVRNYDHVLAAMEAGLLRDAVVIARFLPRGAMREGEWVDGRGVTHRIIAAESVQTLPASALELLSGSSEVVLDVDLDCFTTPLVEDPTSFAPWSRDEIRSFVLPPGTSLWNIALPKTRVFTFAREPFHCGGLVAGARLFEDAAAVFFQELFGADAP